jgi:glutathione S-transferase
VHDAETPLGIVPTLYVDDVWLSQTLAIGHYLGATFGGRSAHTDVYIHVQV